MKEARLQFAGSRRSNSGNDLSEHGSIPGALQLKATAEMFPM
jgi:hypothetical protein